MLKNCREFRGGCALFHLGVNGLNWTNKIFSGKLLVNWLQVSVCKQQHVHVFVCRKCCFRQLQLHEKLPKVGKPKSSGPSDFEGFNLGTGVALVNNIEGECFGILHTKSPPLSSEKKLIFHFTNQQRHILLCWENDRNPKLSSGCSSLSEETLKFLLTTNRSVTNHCTYQWWHLLQAAKHVFTQWAIVKVMTFFCLSSNGNLQSLYLSRSPPPTQSSLLFALASSSLAILAQVQRSKKIWDNRGLWTL